MHLIPEATILDIQRMSTEDGPGLRTTLFFKGCSLSCAWCHNPESIDMRPVVQWSRNKCIGCDSCRDRCDNGALAHLKDGIRLDSGKCTLCLACVRACPSGALNVKGERHSTEKLLAELLKDKAYFGREGGVTLSGGEPLLQPDAVLWLLRKLKIEGLQTALDTAGLIPYQSLAAALDDTDLLLYDIKLIDSERHKELTGSGNEKILDNLRKAGPLLSEKRTRLWIRTPVIPGATDSRDNIREIALFIENNLRGIVERWELCAFNNLCESKYKLLGIPWPYKDAALMEKAEMECLAETAKNELAGSEITVLWTGATAPVKEGSPDEQDN